MTLTSVLYCRVPLLLAIFVCVLSTSGCGRNSPPRLAEDRQLAPVKIIAPVVIALEERTELVGSTVPLPKQVARITSQVEGRVISILEDAQGKHLVEGQWIDQGQVVVQ